MLGTRLRRHDRPAVATPRSPDIVRSQLAELADRVERGQWRATENALNAFIFAHQIVHDGYRNLVARILSVTLEKFGQEAVESLNEAHGTWEMLKQAVSLSPRELVRWISAVNHWRMSRFRVTEDERRITFLLQPCGSGGRLINEGRYYVTGERAYALMSKGSGKRVDIR